MKIILIFISFSLFVLNNYCSAQQMDSVTIPYSIINSVPQNADVYLESDLVGETPLHAILNNVSGKKITLKHHGFIDYTFYANSEDSVINKFITLAPKAGTKINLSGVEENKGHFFNKPRKMVPVVLSAIITAGSGFAAYYFKSLAIERNDDYNLYGNQQDLDKKKKYDLLGGISLGVFQVGLTAFLYFMFGNN